MPPDSDKSDTRGSTNQETAGREPQSSAGSYYQALIEAADDPIFQLDRKGNYLFTNDASSRRLGLSKEQFIGRNIRDFFPAEAGRLFDSLDSVFATGQVVSTVKRVSIRGKPVDFSAVLVPLKSSEGVVESVLVILRDVSRIRKWATAARRNQRRIRQLFRNMGEGVGIVDADERFRFVNPAAHTIFGVPPGTLKNRNLREFVTEEGWQQILDQSLNRKQGLRNNYQLEIVRPDGEKRFLQVTATPRHSRSGTYLGAFGVFYDATLQKRAEEALRRTSEELEEIVALRTEELRESRERLRLLTASIETSREEESKRISREIHDELGQNLTAAKYEVSSIRNGIPPDHPEVQMRLDALLQRLDAVSEDVRRIARNLRPPLLDHFGLEAALECLAGDFQQNTGIACKCQLGSSDDQIEEPVAISVFRICQEALTNVARHSQAKQVGLTLSRANDQLLIQIADDGRGITADDLRKPSLGLLGMEERARRLGGRLKIGPAGTKGTKVDIVIPLRCTSPSEPGG